MRRVLVLVFPVLLCWSPAGAQEGRVSLVSRAPFPRVAEAMDRR